MNARLCLSRCVARSVALAALALTTAVAAANGQRLSPPQHFTVQSDGHPLAVWARLPPAPRAAVLLLHGRTWSSRPDFDLEVPGLHRSVLESLETRGFAAYALDLRGYGETPRDATGWITPRRAAADVVAVLAWMAARHPALPRPALLGWSTGAAVAHLTAATSPPRMSSLILFGYAPNPNSVAARNEIPADPPMERNTRAAAVNDFISPKVTPRAVVTAFVEEAMRTDPIMADWRDDEEFIWDSARVSVPTLVMYGDRDPSVDAKDARAFVARLATRDKQLVVLPGADHFAHVEDTHDAWVAAVANFLNRHAVSGR